MASSSITAQLFAMAFTITYALFGGAMVIFGLLVKVIKKGPKRVFSWKTRNTRPKCLDNPELGTHGFIRTKEVRLHYVSAGYESKPLMLMLHGFPECWYSWRYQIMEFKKDYRVVAIDQRGYGDSDTPSGVANYTMKKLTEDIKEVVEGLGYSSCTLVAHDWGGAIAWYVTATYPDMVDQLIVMNIPHPRCFNDNLNGNWRQILASWYMFFFQLPFLPELNCQIDDYSFIYGAFMSDGMGLRHKENMSKEDIEAFKYCASKKGNLTGMINYYRAAIRYRSSGIKSTMSTPTLIIWGDQDKALTIKLLDGTEKYVQNLTIKIVPGASHWVQQDAPDVVNKHMRDFLNRK